MVRIDFKRTSVLLIGALVALSLAACPKSRQKEPEAGPTTEPPKGELAPSGSPIKPLVGLGDDKDPRLEGLPAVASDAGVVAWSHELADGARGNPNATLVLFDVGKREATRVPILSPDEYDVASGDDPEAAALLATVEDRIGKARAALAGRTWHAMEPMKLTAETGQMSDRWVRTLAAQGVTIRYDEPKLTVSVDGKPVIDVAREDMKRPDERMPECDDGADCVCTHPGRLDRAWVDRGAKVALIAVAYTGTDICWEPEPHLEVVSWREP